ncbi:thiamine-phosphate kinase [Thermovibrio ammonificans]|jgi:thiamine-monophosphate kinase|uniref:Thiamine-monophosphate kinase n=1 Tax=Thermovibrio ammonificans (strain DSM 15698 / JCM 12110 / HB-1) TaxID=648996 RepID=E8T260_THEA1|nr:thiamine-phosphate kinase [Thermovibrio ammonificans]ADU96955.1 thiamine-monophosphate kinase [Thermovibrio ammonificans HB-1]
MRTGEFELIRALSELTPVNGETVVGIGDDAAVVKLRGPKAAISTDALVEGSHFKSEWRELVPELFELLGRKLLAVSVSDLASTGAVPKFATVTLGVTPETEEGELLALYKGLGELARTLNVAVVGGDTVKSSTLFFDLTLIGEVKGEPLLRSRAEPGEVVAVTGSFGDSYGGLVQLLKGEVVNRRLVERFLNPPVRLREGLKAAGLGVKCGTDVSDGLAFNLYTVAESSRVAVEVESSKIPVSDDLVNLLGRQKALEAALFGGEDYELIVTAPEKLAEELEKAGFKVIGRVREGSGVFVDGKRIEPKGYDHFCREG